MHFVFSGLAFVFIYVDDLLVASRNMQEHLEHLRIVFERLQEFGLRINASKCVFGVPNLEFLGHEVSAEGIKPSTSRVEAIANFATPTSLHQTQRFVGMVNFYHRFIPRLAQRLAPIHAHMAKLQRVKAKSTKQFTWPEDCDVAF